MTSPLLMGDQMLRNLGLQNIQTFIKMVLAFMLASLFPWDWIKLGFDLVLGTSNLDDGLCGHLTKVTHLSIHSNMRY
ncbi:hypothetical protein C5167_030477 [Papaver somniferum]|nr:hypothetical protein C5167_030477 [Papaver somniferum]